ncbi:MAG TPA: hypothetical protein VFI95_01175 [Terriglobales bacterium]|nr:hypothetical protein [Terriglobales bacterium]
MKSAAEVLLIKELELQKVKKEVEALRMVARLLSEGDDVAIPFLSLENKVVQLPN